MAEDKPIGVGGADEMVTISLPRAAKPVSGDFTVNADPQALFTKIVFRGAASPNEFQLQQDADGAFLVWTIRGQWSFSIE